MPKHLTTTFNNQQDLGTLTSTPDIDLSTSRLFRLELGASTVTPTVTEPSDDTRITLVVLQDDTGGRDLALDDTQFTFQGVTEPTWTNGTAGQMIILEAEYLASDGIFVVVAITPWFDPVLTAPIYWTFASASDEGDLEDGTTTRDEISGVSACVKSGNEGYFIGCDDSVSGEVYVFDETGTAQGKITLTGASWTDAEAMSIVDDDGVAKVWIFAVGDNAQNRSTVEIIRFDEPTITGSDIVIPNDGSWEEITVDYPDSGAYDVETCFIDLKSTSQKVWFITKRDSQAKKFSMPYQTSAYTGTQTLTDEGLVHADVIQETGGVISPSGPVSGCISHDGKHVLIKNYNTVWQFSRESTADTTMKAMLESQPVEVEQYVGLGSHPTQEPQGESIWFSKNDDAFWTISEEGTGSGVSAFPLFKYSNNTGTATLDVQHGANSYSSGEDTYVWDHASNGATNYSTETTTVSDKNPTDERFALHKWGGLDTLLAGKTVKSATMTFNVTAEGQGADFYKILDLNSESYSTITWDNWTPVADTDYDSNIVANWAGDDGYTGEITVTFNARGIAMIQDWIDNPSNNFGVLVEATDSSDGQQFSSNEDSTVGNRPKLSITYYDV